MFHKPVSGLAGIALLVVCAAAASAQDFRVLTRISDVHTPAKPRLVGRSLTLFHAGRAYDCLDSASQVTIFEPAHEQFVIVDEARHLMTVLPFEQIKNRLFQAARKTEKYVGELDGQHTEKSKRLAGLLRFQLKPVFQTEEDKGQPRLKLSSPFISYDIKYDQRAEEQAILFYLDYADWAARLNFLLNDRALLPDARLAVDDILRRRQLLPVEVVLHASHEDGLHLRAEHRFKWDLDGDDRKTIVHWEKVLASKSLKEVPPAAFYAKGEPAKTEDRR